MVDIVCRGPKYEKLMRDAPTEADTGVLSFDDVMVNVT